MIFLCKYFPNHPFQICAFMAYRVHQPKMCQPLCRHALLVDWWRQWLAPLKTYDNNTIDPSLKDYGCPVKCPLPTMMAMPSTPAVGTVDPCTRHSWHPHKWCWRCTRHCRPLTMLHRHGHYYIGCAVICWLLMGIWVADCVWSLYSLCKSKLDLKQGSYWSSLLSSFAAFLVIQMLEWKMKLNTISEDLNTATVSNYASSLSSIISNCLLSADEFLFHYYLSTFHIIFWSSMISSVICRLLQYALLVAYMTNVIEFKTGALNAILGRINSK